MRSDPDGGQTRISIENEKHANLPVPSARFWFTGGPRRPSWRSERVGEASVRTIVLTTPSLARPGQDDRPDRLSWLQGRQDDRPDPALGRRQDDRPDHRYQGGVRTIVMTPLEPG